MIRLLLIDDDPDESEIFYHAASSMDTDIDYISYHNAQKALQALRSGDLSPDYIFLDMNMPVMDGRHFLQHIKKDPQLNDIPVVIYTTSSRPKEKDELMRAGAASFLTKPDTLGELKEALSDILGLHHC